jgi:hypothetical protein
MPTQVPAAALRSLTLSPSFSCPKPSCATPPYGPPECRLAIGLGVIASGCAGQLQRKRANGRRLTGKLAPSHIAAQGQRTSQPIDFLRLFLFTTYLRSETSVSRLCMSADPSEGRGKCAGPGSSLRHPYATACLTAAVGDMHDRLTAIHPVSAATAPEAAQVPARQASISGIQVRDARRAGPLLECIYRPLKNSWSGRPMERPDSTPGMNALRIGPQLRRPARAK